MAAATDSLVVLTSTPDEIGAAAIVALLEEHDIKAIATGGTTAGFRAEAPGWVQVLVPERDQQSAAMIVEQHLHGDESGAWDQADVGQPEEKDGESSVHLLQSEFWRYLAVVLVLLIGMGLLSNSIAIGIGILRGLFS